jgi:ATP-dependent helicase HrpB
MTPFPVDSIIPQILSALAEAPVIVIQAPPGSGKSTRIPVALMHSGWLGSNSLLMLEPRRLAAVNLATWMARQLGEPVGGTVGYAVRFDRKISTRTRLEIVTEGLLTRRLQTDPYLDGVGAVIFDEFHERTIHADTALALCIELQQTVRPDLRIVIMSATLDRAKMAALLPAARVVTADGGLHPVAIRYLGEASDPVTGVVAGVNQALSEQAGDILAFLPGAGEIKRAAARLQELHPAGTLRCVPLYGDLPFAEQERAILPGQVRKVVLATNIAETSLTIEGITAVVDAGLVRRARFDRSRGIDRLVTERTSRASAEQRAGRAGRLGPGRCYRLWSDHQQQALLPFDPPEILTADLSELALNLALWGVSDPEALVWADPPPAGALAGAQETLRLLGALDNEGRITPAGKKMALLPLHPRLAGLLVRAAESGCGPLGADLAAILAERSFIRGQRELTATSSDLHDRLEILLKWRRYPGQMNGAPDLDPATLRGVERLSQQLRRIAAISGETTLPSLDKVSQLAAAAFPDRIARQREPGSRRYLLANGTGGELDARSGIVDAPYIVVTSMDGGRGSDGRIFSASLLAEDVIRSLAGKMVVSRRRVFWDAAARRVAAREEELFGAITLSSRPVKALPEEICQAVSDYVNTSGGGPLLLPSSRAAQLQARVLLLRSLFPEDDWPDVSSEFLLATIDVWLPTVLAASAKPESFAGIDPAAIISCLLDWRQTAQLDELAPTHLVVPSDFRIPLDYAAVDGPVMAVKLQELFGLADTPLIASGRRAVLLHLLSPAGRPIQVTRDLRSFWDKTYPEVRRELKGRYPKHPWPDDPWSAQPTRYTKKRSG